MTTKLFKSMNFIRCVSGASLNLFRYAAMVLVLLTLGMGNAWAGSSSTQGGAYLKDGSPTGSGKVYVAANNTTVPADNKYVNCTTDGYTVDGTSGKSKTSTFYFYAKANPGYKFTGWYKKNTDDTYTLVTTNASWSGSVTSPASEPSFGTSYTYLNRYAEFIKVVSYSFVVPEHGSFTVTNNGTSMPAYETFEAEGIVHAVATPVEGYRFGGWYTTTDGGTTRNYFSYTAETDLSFSDDATVGADFRPDNGKALFHVINGGLYENLNTATTEANTVSPKVVVVAQDGLLSAGSYNIPSGVTLLVPYNSANLVQTEPTIINKDLALKAYKKLTFADGANISVSGVICVGGQIMSAGGGYPSGYTTGACGVIDMSQGGHIELKSGATLYAWGFITGQDLNQGNNTVGAGTITAKSGSKVWENLAFGDWRGGTACSTIKNTRFFPFQSYFVQNIEVQLSVEFGAEEKCYSVVNASSSDYDVSATLIGQSSSLFKLTDANSVVCKWYDATTDLMCYELQGTANFDAIVVSGLPVIQSISSEDFDLPISSNMHIILSNSNVTLGKDMVMQPGSKIEIKSGSSITVSAKVYLYDKDDWGAYAGPDYYFHNYGNANGIFTRHKNRGNGKSKDGLDDAQFIVDGTLTVTGKLYSTTHGADIMGNGGGKVIFSASLPDATTIPAFTSNGNAVSGGVAVTAANLCNEDGTYTKSIGSSTFHNNWGRWFIAADKDERANHTYAFKYMANGNSGDDVPTDAVYAPDKTGLVAGMKWCNVSQDATCTSIYNATQSLNGVAASDIKYTYPSDAWLQLRSTETANVFGGSDNNLYAQDGCTISSLGSVDENCLYTISEVKKALVNGSFVALTKNTNDEAWHNTANAADYYICFEGCNWHHATKEAEEKAYKVEDSIYIWYSGDWKAVEREVPFFFDYNDQNVKRYYEYEDGAWVLASPRVRVVDAIETRDFYFINEAFTVANGKKNTTITLLKDIPMVATSLTYSAKNTTCTLDLNGHTMRGAVPYTDKNNIGGFLVIDASGSTFTITDNTTDKNGRLENICEQNQVTYTVRLVAGTLYINAGYIYAENPKQYSYGTSSVGGTATNATDVGTRCVYLSAGTTTYIQGGTIHAKSSSAAHGIFELSSKNNNTNLNISNGTIYAEAARYAYGVRARGKLNITGGLIKSRLNTSLTNGNETYMSKKKDDYTLHRYGYGVYVEPVVSATASENYGGTLTMSAGRIESYNDNYTEGQNLHTYGINFGATYTNVPAGSTAADGTYSQKCSGKGTITGGSIYVENQGLLSYGILHGGNYNSYESKSHILKISNCDITVKAYQTAYGIYANASIGSTSSSSTRNLAAMSYGDVELTNCTVYTEATVGTTAYAVYGHTTYATIFADQTEYDTSSKTNISQTRFTGEYAIGAKIKIVGGTYTAKAATTTAYAVCTNTRSKTIYGTDTKVEADRTVGGNAEGYVTLIIDGGTFIGEATTTTARAVSSGGYTTITGGTFNATAGTYYAYALYALSGKLTATNSIINATANGRVKSSDNNAYAYGALADCGIVGSGNQAWTGFTYFGEIELNNCTVTATATTYDNARGISVNATSALLTQANYEAEKTKRKWDEATTWAAYQAVFPGDNTSRAVAAKAKVTGGSLTVTAGRANAYGAFSTKTAITNTQGAMASPEMTLTNVAITSKTRTNTTAYGVYSGGSTTIDGCTITATAGDPTYKSTASGVLNVDKTTTIKNSTITATATDAAYGLEGRAEINATHGYCWHGEFDLSEAGNTIVTAEAKTKAKTAYTIFLKSAKLNIATGGAFDGDYATAASATINGGTYNAKFNTSGSAYVISLGSQQIQGDAVAQPEVLVNGGFFNGSTAEVGTAGIVGHMQLKGGYFVHNTNLATYAVAPKKVLTLRESHTLYPDYKYTINEGGTVTWKNGDETLKTEMYESGETPEYTGETPTKAEDAEYTYTHNGWDPAIAAMANADQTYTATFNHIEKKYTVNVAAGANGSVSPGSVNNIGCVTASGDITATPDAGYSFSGWTLPEGVTAATGYTASSNPIRIHAIAADKTITTNFTARNDISYTVKHWQQNLDNNEYTEYESEDKTGTTATATAAAAKSYTGFTAQSFEQGTIAGNGSTIVNIYYNRNTFTITWLDGNGNAVETDEYVKYGATPSYDGETPTKTATAQYTYSFSGWDSEIVAVTEEKTYTAQFISTPQTYNVTLNTNEGTINDGDVTTYTYGVGATLPTDVTQEGYTFGGWFDNSGLTGDAVTSISTDATGNKEYWAKWTTASCTIRWVNYDGTPLCDPAIVQWGGEPAYPSHLDNPEREGDDNRTYTFIGWYPEIHAANGNETYTAQYYMSITTGEPGTYTVSGTEDAVATTVQVSGKLNVSSGTLTTGDLIVEASSDGSGTIDGIGNVTVTGDAYFDYKFDVDPWHWSAFGVPFEIDLDAAAPLKERTEELAILGRDDYDIVYYDTGERAAHGASKNCWKYVDNETHRLIPGRLYMIAFDKHVGRVGVVRFKKAASALVNCTTPVQLITTGPAGGNNNWNGIANPMMYHALLGAGVTECQVHDGGEIGKDGYYTYDMNDKKFFVGKAAFVQVPNEQKEMTTTQATDQSAIVAKAPRRTKASVATDNRYDIQIAPADGAVADRLLILAEEDKADEYVIVSDLAKAGVSPVRAQMWVDRYGEKLCKNTTAYINNKANYPLVISTPKAGEYDLFIDDQPNDETMLYLTYDGNAIWNLSYGGYVVNLEKGTTSHYGLRIVRTPKVSTGIEETTIQNGDPIRKVMVDGKVYIIRNGEIYGITGQKAQ